GYYTDQHRLIFLGLAPASEPRFVVSILVEDPRRQSYAGQVSAPVLHQVMKDALRLYNVPYDKPLRVIAP
ncbi:penicillin-binding transpeptidase domain-containing protein, partial [Moraxella catarrhalis]|uniref:penicillin-binding transpeptidase domain-containing protein n=1 Tax=Moraxella catarrhalis TaxID=480 RepID=UPI0012C51444